MQAVDHRYTRIYIVLAWQLDSFSLEFPVAALRFRLQQQTVGRIRTRNRDYVPMLATSWKADR